MARKIKGTSAKAWFAGQSFNGRLTEAIPTHQHTCKHCGSVFTCNREHFATITEGPQRGKQIPCPPPEFVNTCAKPECAFRGF